MSARKAAFALAVVTALATPGTALAFCRTSVCNGNTSQVCTPAGPGDCGTPLVWKSACVGFWMQDSASSQIGLALATSVVETAFTNWTNVDCGGGAHPSIVVKEGGNVSCHTAEYNQDGANANIIMFDDASWPYGDTTSALALTTVTYDLDSGAIFDADMELNSHDAMFTTSDSNVQVDLPSIVQHESGHFLGLAHSQDAEATMFASYTDHDISLRTLDADDIAAICATYPPGRAIDPSCSITPRHGFSSDCDAAATSSSTSESGSGCCSIAAGGSNEGAPAIAASLLLALSALGRGRSRRRSAGSKR
jgi:hypothetical protein